MKQAIHPEYVDAVATCASCGTVWHTKSTKPQLRVELCSNCHPFYTGQQRIVDTAGQVERFMKRVERAEETPRRKKADRRRQRIEARQRMRSHEEQLLVVGDDANEPETES